MAFAADMSNGFEVDLLTTSGGIYGTINSAVTARTVPRYPGGGYLLCSPTTTAGSSLSFASNGTTSITKRSSRLYFRIESLPTATIPIGNVHGALALTPDGTLTWGASGAWTNVTGFLTSTTAITAQTWCRLEFLADATQGNTAYWRIDGVDQPVGVRSGTTSTYGATPTFGTSTAPSQAYTAQYDDYITGSWTAPGDWPGAGRAVALRPVSANLAAAGTAFQTEASVAVTTTTGYDRLSNTLWTGDTTYVKEVTASASATALTPYVELGFTATEVTADPNIVTARVNHAAATTTANAARTVARSGTVDTYVHGTAAAGATIGITTDLFKSIRVVPGTAPWTVAQVGAAVIRYGMAFDVSPLPYWKAAALEVDFPETEDPVTPPPRRRVGKYVF